MDLNIEVKPIGTAPATHTLSFPKLETKPETKRKLRAGDWVKGENGALDLLLVQNVAGDWSGVSFEGPTPCYSYQIPLDSTTLISPRAAALMIAPELGEELAAKDAKIAELEAKSKERALLLVKCGEEIGALKAQVKTANERTDMHYAANVKLASELATLRKPVPSVDEWEVWEGGVCVWKRGKNGIRLWLAKEFPQEGWIKSDCQRDADFYYTYYDARLVTDPARKAEILAMGGGK